MDQTEEDIKTDGGDSNAQESTQQSDQAEITDAASTEGIVEQDTPGQDEALLTQEEGSKSTSLEGDAIEVVSGDTVTETEQSKEDNEASEEQPPNEASDEQPSNEASEEQPPNEASEGQPPNEASEEQPPNEASESEEQQLPNEASEEQPPDKASEEQPPNEASELEEQPPIEASEEHPPNEASEEQPPNEASEGQPPPDSETTAGREEQAVTQISEKTVVESAVEEAVNDEEETEPEQVFDYSYDSLKSGPKRVNISTDNMLELLHSFGYECQKRSNLAVLSKKTVAYAAGNMVVLLNLSSQKQSFFRSLGGGGIGAIAVHPSTEYFAVGEKGTQPVIAIYTYPHLKLYRVLRGGTEEMYSHMDFSPGSGKLLASIGGNPDYMLTVWDWKREHIVLRSKAFSQDIYRVTFSPENPGQLTTSGTGHIRFWKMATTFTGLKLQGYLGKFGRVEISDISAYVELPDGKVLSGTEWGNLLLWDGGFIKVEISRKGKKFCHNGMIETIYLDEGELISAGVDGFVRVWDFESIDSADITDDNAVFEIDPLVEIKVGNDVSIKSMARSVDPDTPTLWFAQDACGAIWKIDTVVSHTRKAPEKLISFHSGPITGLACSPIAHLAATIAENGSVRVYDLPTKEVLCHSQFPSGGSSLLWAPPTIDPAATTLITGHQDGVLRVLQLEEKTGQRHRGGQRYQLTLLHALKPHSQAITCLAVHPNGQIVASGGKNSTVFFMSAADNYEPIGFVSTPSPVATIQWSSGQQQPLHLLVCCEDGSMMEIEAPKKEKYDTSKSYYLDPVKYTARRFSSIKDRLRAEEEEVRLTALREAKLREKEAKKQKRRELLGDEYVSQDEDEVEEESEGCEGVEGAEGVEGQPPTKEEKVKVPGTILSSFYSHENEKNFWVSMSGHDAGYLYQCSLEGAISVEPEPYESPHTLPVPPVSGEDTALHCLAFSSSGDYLLTGSSNGIVRIHPLSAPYALSTLDSYWSLSMHDNHYGSVSHLATTFDDSYLVSGGGDGNVFVYQANLPTAEQREKNKAQKVKIPAESGKSAHDIEDPEHYSIEDAKQKAEHDRMMKIAEEKKQTVRRQIASLRRTFGKLRQRDNELPQELRLDPRDFVMDPHMEEQLRLETLEKASIVKREMAWESEKIAVSLRKLQNKYKDNVASNLITVWTFTEIERVTSFRTARPSDVFVELMDKILEAESSIVTPWTALGDKDRRKSRVMGGVGDKHMSERSLEGEGGEERTLSKQEYRRLRKETRKREWEELNQARPNTKLDDPEEASALKVAQSSVGDYKLKTASDYVVPGNRRTTTESKRKQLLLLRQQIFDEKMTYNDKLIALRDWKLQVIDKISSLVSEIDIIQSSLPKPLHKPLPPIPIIKREEVPERRLEYSKDSLLAFKEQLKSKEDAERQAAAAGADGGFFGGFGGEGSESGGEPVEETKDESDEGSVELSRPGSTGSVEEEETLTPLQTVLRKEQQIRSVYKRDCLLAEVEALKEEFDEALLRLRHEKAELDITMVTADLRHITQFEELQLLKEFEKKEMSFTSRYRNKKRERLEMEEKIEESHWSVSEREEKLGQLVEQEKALEQSFLTTVGDNNKFKEFLLKVFRKKIKRAKKKVEVDKKEDDDDDEESDEESDSDYISSSDDESDIEGEMDDSICPPGCDPTLYEQATLLREKRLDLEEAINDEKKSLEVGRKELEGMKKKAKTMETHVKSALNELRAFQLKKQQRLNELDQVAVLALHQILYHQPEGEAPSSIASCLVFPASALYHLSRRIGELTTEKQEEKKRYKELRQRHLRLLREKKEMLSKIVKLDGKAKEAMMLKFGRVVDLDRLEGLSVNHIVEELRSKLRVLEEKAENELVILTRKIDSEKKRLAQMTRENTKRLDRQNELLIAKQNLEDQLNSRQKSMSKDVAGGDGGVEVGEEKERLLALVRIQVREIEALREEIQVLQLKGGRIAPPPQPPPQTV